MELQLQVWPWDAMTAQQVEDPATQIVGKGTPGWNNKMVEKWNLSIIWVKATSEFLHNQQMQPRGKGTEKLYSN